MIRNRTVPSEITLAFKKNGKYDPKHELLVNELGDFISYYVQDNKCITNQPLPDLTPGSRLKDLMCRMSFVYTPLPTLHMKEKSLLVKNGVKIGSGVNGKIYSSIFDGNQIITKIPMEYHQKDIVEHFMSFRIINTILAHNLLTRHLVPSYGLFVCPSSIGTTSKLQICQSSTSKTLTNHSPNVFMVQRQIIGNTLSSFLKSSQVSWDDFKLYMRQVGLTMCCLEASPFRISHNDLHVENIMIEGKMVGQPGNAVIIDWGFSRFVNPTTKQIYQPFTYDEYMREFDPHTGASDYFDLLKHVLFCTEGKNDVYSKKIYMEVRRQFILFSNHFVDSAMKMIPNFQDYQNAGHGQYFLYRLLRSFERKNPNIHTYHIGQLRKLTYRVLFDPWFLPEDRVNIQTIVAQLSSKDFFAIPKPVAHSPASTSLSPIIIPAPRPVAPVIPRATCQCRQENGVHCPNKPKPGSDYCGKHQKCKRPISHVPAPAPVAIILPAPAPVILPAPAPVVLPAPAPVVLPCACVAIIKSGPRKNQVCGKPCKHGNLCGIHG